MVMDLEDGTDTVHHSEWDGDGTLDGVRLGQFVSDGDRAGAGDLHGMVVIDLGVAGTVEATGDPAGMEMVIGVVATGATQDHVMLQVDQFIETTLIRVVHHQDPALREDMTATV